MFPPEKNSQRLVRFKKLLVLSPAVFMMPLFISPYGVTTNIYEGSVDQSKRHKIKQTQVKPQAWLIILHLTHRPAFNTALM